MSGAVYALTVLLWLVPPNDGEESRRLSSRIISTQYGSLKGVLVSLANRNVGPVEVFLGIPYASPPVGELRFMPPTHPTQWRGIRTADRFGPVCPQRYPDIQNETDSLRRMPAGRLEYLKKLIPFLRNESEDCLFLNIYCPVKKERMSVVVFLHGDSYEWSSGNPYDGTVLAGFGEVIVITLNYRLGILGFLPAMEASSRGNYGLLDILSALRWIHDNIAQFGGDARNITLLGHGYGASFAHLLLLSPLSKGLFQRVVLQSGSALSPWAIATEAMTFGRHVARKLGCPVQSQPALIRCMRQRPLSDIMRVQLLVPEYLTAFGPTVDGLVIPADPQYALPNASTDKVDVLIGITRIESFFYFGAGEERYGIEAVRRDRILRTLVRNLFTFHLQEIFLTIVNEYTDWSRPVQHPVNILDGTVEALTDALVVAPAISSANLLSQWRHRTFLYLFNYPTEASDFPQRLVCVHGEDIPYLFGAPLVNKLAHFPNNYTRSEAALSEAIMLYWTNFVKYGNPNVVHNKETPEKSRGKFERFLWPLYDSINQKYLALAMKPKVRDHYHAHRLSFWLSLIPKLHRQGTSIASQHHLLEEHDNPSTYDGVVRQGPLLPLTRGVSRVPSTPLLRAPEDFPTTSSAIVESSSSSLHSSSRQDEPVETLAPDTSPPPETSSFTALRLTIIVGCCLLVLNLCVFAGLYYQRRENALKEELESAPSTIKPQVRAPPPSPDLPRSFEMVPPPPLFLQDIQQTGTSKVRWAPDVGYEAERDAVWL